MVRGIFLCLIDFLEKHDTKRGRSQINASTKNQINKKSSFVNFLGRQNALAFVEHLHQVNAFGKITDVVVFAFEVFECFDFSTNEVENGDLRNEIIVVVNGDIVDGRIGENGELWFCRIWLLRLKRETYQR